VGCLVGVFRAHLFWEKKKKQEKDGHRSKDKADQESEEEIIHAVNQPETDSPSYFTKSFQFIIVEQMQNAPPLQVRLFLMQGDLHFAYQPGIVPTLISSC
jgi:hypothetical protein